MRILVTGAKGFVGTHLTRELEDAGHYVIGSDLTRDEVDNVLSANLAYPGSAELLVNRYGPDYVVHLAARYGRLLCRDQPHRAVTDNAAATTELAAACAERGIPVLYASSSEVYGDHGKDTITEQSALRTPTTIYGLSKRWGEEALKLYLPPEKLCIVRLNMLMGEGQRAGYGCCAVATFIKQALAGESFTVHRNTSRSYLHVSDAVRALRLLIEQGHSGIFNCSNDREYMSTEDLAELVAEEVVDRTGQPVAMDVIDPPSIQIPHKQFSSAKLRNATGWEPEVSLSEAIRRTVEAQMREPAPSYA